MSNKKMTKRENFELLLTLEDVKSNASIVDFINHEIDLLAKRNSADRKPSPKQIENEGFKQAILDFMKAGQSYTITDLIKGIEVFNEMSNQKISALVKQMYTTDEEDVSSYPLIRTEEKRKAYFSLNPAYKAD